MTMYRASSPRVTLSTLYLFHRRRFCTILLFSPLLLLALPSSVLLTHVPKEPTSLLERGAAVLLGLCETRRSWLFVLVLLPLLSLAAGEAWGGWGGRLSDRDWCPSCVREREASLRVSLVAPFHLQRRDISLCVRAYCLHRLCQPTCCYA